MVPLGVFDPGLVAVAWFDPAFDPDATAALPWFDVDLTNQSSSSPSGDGAGSGYGGSGSGGGGGRWPENMELELEEPGRLSQRRKARRKKAGARAQRSRLLAERDASLKALGAELSRLRLELDRKRVRGEIAERAVTAALKGGLAKLAHDYGFDGARNALGAEAVREAMRAWGLWKRPT